MKQSKASIYRLADGAMEAYARLSAKDLQLGDVELAPDEIRISYGLGCYVVTGMHAVADHYRTLAQARGAVGSYVRHHVSTPLACKVCGEDSPARGPFAGIVHRWGPREHHFQPA